MIFGFGKIKFSILDTNVRSRTPATPFVSNSNSDTNNNNSDRITASNRLVVGASNIASTSILTSSGNSIAHIPEHPSNTSGSSLNR